MNERKPWWRGLGGHRSDRAGPDRDGDSRHTQEPDARAAPDPSSSTTSSSRSRTPGRFPMDRPSHERRFDPEKVNHTWFD